MHSEPTRCGAPALAVHQAKRIVADLFVPRPAIYWADFLTTIFTGHICFALVQRPDVVLPTAEASWLRPWLAAISFAAACLLYYRAVMFIHELVHRPEKSFRPFAAAWNLLCGIPFLVPSFTYATHLEHHSPRKYGTREDGEYLALAKLRPLWLLAYFTQGLYLPPLAVLRFLVLTPLTWISPALRRWCHQRCSSLVIDASYLRPLPSEAELRLIRLQEAACFALCLAVLVVVILFGRWPFPLLLQIYATGAVVITLNAIRTAAAHRWRSDGEEMSFLDQVRDSVTIDSDWPLAVLLHPVGLRYHALHHLFPSLPYHNARAAHRRLLAELPDSAYQATLERTALGAIWRWRDARGELTAAKDQTQSSFPVFGEAPSSKHQTPNKSQFPRTE
jgi:fatty acid desaturase